MARILVAISSRRIHARLEPGDHALHNRVRSFRWASRRRRCGDAAEMSHACSTNGEPRLLNVPRVNSSLALLLGVGI